MELMRTFTFIGKSSFLALLFFTCQLSKQATYVCPPCDLSCDTLTFDGPGYCPHCNMQLVLASNLFVEADLPIDEIQILPGSGAFRVSGRGRKAPITVFYHRPKSYTADSDILMVIPGAGRNGDSYRDAWIEISEKHGVLVLSPKYAEEAYGFEDYHLGGLIRNSNLLECASYEDHSNRVHLDESCLVFGTTQSPDSLLFPDLDRIFDLVVQQLQSNQTHYDLFGHSAGGQILHRMVLFYPDTKADRILAGNAGFYTLADTSLVLPFGVKSTWVDRSTLAASFGKKLILILGELDNETETGGTMLRSPTVDQQGTHRLERGKYFFRQAQAMASDLNLGYNWELVLVPNVGHNQRKMAEAAGKYLYEDFD